MIKVVLHANHLMGSTTGSNRDKPMVRRYAQGYLAQIVLINYICTSGYETVPQQFQPQGRFSRLGLQVFRLAEDPLAWPS